MCLEDKGHVHLCPSPAGGGEAGVCSPCSLLLCRALFSPVLCSVFQHVCRFLHVTRREKTVLHLFTLRILRSCVTSTISEVTGVKSRNDSCCVYCCFYQVDAQVRETVRLLLSDDPQAGSFERLLDKFSSHFVGKDDLQVLLRDLELQILKNISHHLSVTKQMPACEAVMSAVSEAGVSGITEAVGTQGGMLKVCSPES